MTEKSQPRDLSKRYLIIPIGHLKTLALWLQLLINDGPEKKYLYSRFKVEIKMCFIKLTHIYANKLTPAIN